MSDVIQNRIFQVIGDGARPAKFKATININQKLLEKYNVQLQDIDVFCFQAQIPEMRAGNIEYKYKGRNIPVPSVQEFEQTIALQFYNDEKHTLRRLFLDWIESNQVEVYDGHKTEFTKDDLAPTSIFLYQLNYELNKETTIYSLWNVFPISVGEIEFNSESLNEKQIFTVTFKYSHFDLNTVKGIGMTADDLQNAVKSTIREITNSVMNDVKTAATKIAEPYINKAKDLLESINPFSRFLG